MVSPFIVKVENLISSRHISGSQGSAKSPALQLIRGTPNMMRNNNELLLVADKVRLLRISFLVIVVFCFIVSFFLFLAYTQNFSLSSFLILHTYAVLNFKL